MALVFFCAALALSWWGTGMLQRHVAEGLGMIDRPNERSSHTTPTPRGGGLAIVTVSLALSLLLLQQRLLSPTFATAVVGGGVAIALVGFWDDRRHVPAARRLLVHGGAAIWVLFWLGGLPAINVGTKTIVLPAWGAAVLAVFFLVWLVNLYNFMDGIDGIAGAEAVSVSLGAAAILCYADGQASSLSLFVLAGAALGFLCWNWPPAKIFMGDVGSGFLGFVLGVLALYAPVHSRMSFWSWLILLGVFLVDASVTLLVRASRGEMLHVAHRSHAYQRLAQRVRSHGKITVGVLLINVVWLFPLAWLATLRPDNGLWLAVLAMAPLVIICFWAGAGEKA